MSKKIACLVFIMSLFFIGTFLSGFAAANDLQLAEQYAPILYFASNEKCYPVNVSYALDSSNLCKVGEPTPIATSPLSAIMLDQYTTDSYYLDNQRGTAATGDNGIENDYQSKMNALGFTVYAHVDTTGNIIQYWFFYAFNGGDLNRHEGDWEMIQVVLSNSQPSQVMFSQHYSGQSALWRQVDKDGTHVKVYVARGSHANYLKPYSGKVGLASDDVGDNGRVLRPTDYHVDVLANQSWLNFGGRWGSFGTDTSQAAEAAILGEAGPNGPKYRENGLMWQPLAWAGGLQPANDYLIILDWLVYNFVLLFVIITVLSLLVFVFLVYRRHKKHGLGPRLFSMLYIDGFNAKSIGNVLCIVALILAILGLFLPWYTITANVSVPTYPATGTFSALSVDGISGVQIRLPNQSGPVPLGAFALPFSFLIGIGLVFIVLSTVGISRSRKLGKRYLLRGSRLLVPFLLILVFILLLAPLIPMFAPASVKGNADVQSAMKAVSASPINGQSTMQVAEDMGGGSVHLTWGFGIGAFLLLFAGILLLLAGLIELVAHAQFFEEKLIAPPMKPTVVQPQVPPGEEKK